MNTIEQSLNYLTENKYVYTAIFTLIILYSNMLGPDLPDNIVELLDNPIMRIIVFALVGYIANKNVGISLIIALVFIVVLNYISEKKIKNDLKKVEGLRI
jgi:multisubunit Na+/H+ antiporter MnhF subunit